MVGHGYYRYRQSRRTYFGDRKQPSKALACLSSKCRPTNEKSGIKQLGIQITLSRICFKWFVGHLQVVCECGFSTLIGWLCSSHPVFLVDLIIHALGRLYVNLCVFHKSIPRLTQTAPGNLSFVNSMLLSIASTTNMKKSSDCVCGIKCLLVVCLSQCRPTSILHK